MAAWWDEDHELLLLTPAEIEALPDGTVLGCIDGSTATKGADEIDTDVRFGHTAFGVTGDHPLRIARLASLPSPNPEDKP